MATYRVWTWREHDVWHAEVEGMPGISVTAAVTEELERVVRERISAATNGTRVSLDIFRTTAHKRRAAKLGVTGPVLDRATIRALIAAFDLSHVEDSLLDGIQPAVRIRPRRIRPGVEPLLGSSRFGGEPDLPTGMPWPKAQGRSLAMLAQINLGEVPAVLPPESRSLHLPSQGMLWFWYDTIEWPWASERDDPESGFRVIYAAEPGSLVRAATPHELVDSAQWNNACNLTFSGVQSLPWLDLADDCGDLTRFFDLLDVVEGRSGGPSHQLRGNCAACNDSTPEEHPGVVLLAQLVSDQEGPGWGWGDAGSMHFWIDPDHLRQQQFHRAWGVIDSA